jgi:hypothetical protein
MVLETKAVDYIVRRVNTSLEEDVMALNSMAPDTLGDLRTIFKEATVDASANILDEPTAKALMFHIKDSNLETQHEIMAYLDSLLREGSGILKAAILAEFRVRVHERVALVRSKFDESMDISLLDYETEALTEAK